MSNFEKVNAGILFPVPQEKTQSEPWSFTASVKKAVMRFVTWIDGVDVDGQEYWS